MLENFTVAGDDGGQAPPPSSLQHAICSLKDTIALQYCLLHKKKLSIIA
jgi:hypothetical protein